MSLTPFSPKLRRYLWLPLWVVWAYFPTTCWAWWNPGISFGGVYAPNLATGSANGGSLMQLDFGYLWERETWGLQLSLPVETDFATRLAVGPQVRFELYRYFRVLAAPMVDIPLQTPFYSLFFVRGGIEAGYRNTGRYAEQTESPLKAGLYLFVYVDARIPMPQQPTGQEFRLSIGFRMETGF